MDARGRHAGTTRIVGNITLATGFLITIIGLTTNSTPAKGYVFAMMLVVTGAGLRLEAAVTDRR